MAASRVGAAGGCCNLGGGSKHLAPSTNTTFGTQDQERRMTRLVSATLAVAFLCSASTVVAQEPLVQVYLVRHPETEPAPADSRAVHLSDTGRERAALLVPTLAGVRVSYLFASHTVRTREALEGLARDRSLPIVQLPEPGRTLNGQLVTDEVSRREAIEPISRALLSLKPGSVAVVGLNSENIFAVLHSLGVPEAPAGRTCAVGEVCVPCLNNTCFPLVFDRLWYVAFRSGTPGPVVFTELRYGAGWLPKSR
jgi:Histidine phosphatase superfamily (branch 1)